MADFMLQTVKTSLFTSLPIGLILLLIPLLQKRYKAKWRYIVWMVMAIRLLIPFNPTLPQAPVRIELPEQAAAVISQSIENIVFPLSTETGEQAETVLVPHAAPAVSTATPNRTLTPTQIVGVVWFAGVLLFLLYQVSIYQIFLYKLRCSKKENIPPFIRKTVWQLGKEMGICKLPEPVITNVVDTPVLVGAIHPRILLPHTRYSEQAVYFILRHELIHYRRRDMWYKLILLLANAMHWFNPLVYLMTMQAAKDIELSCDDDVVKDLVLNARVLYGETILSVLPKKRRLEPVFSTQFGSTKKNMKNRLRNLLDIKIKSKGMAMLLAVIVFAFSITGMVTFGYAATTLSNNMIHTTAADGTWAAATNITGKTWQQQVDAEIKWLNDIYGEHKNNFIITETLPKAEMYDLSRVQYLYDNSTVFNSMSQMSGGVFQVENKQSFARFGAAYNPDMMQRTIVMVDNNDDLFLDINYSLTQGKLAVWLIDPTGKAAYESELSQSNNKTITVKGVNGLWSVVTVNDGGGYMQGQLSIALRQSGFESIDYATVPFSIERLGQHSFQNGDTLYANVNWDGSGSLMLLYTDMDYTDDEILAPLQGISGIPAPKNIKTDKITMGNVFNFSQSVISPLMWNNTDMKQGSYYFYLIRINQPGQVSGHISRNTKNGVSKNIWTKTAAIVPSTQSSLPADGNSFFQIIDKDGKNIIHSGSFQAKAGQMLTITAISNIKGGSVDLVLFSPSYQEQRITFGSINTTKTVMLTEGQWAYNCTGFFESGTIIINGTIHNTNTSLAPSSPTGITDAE